MSSALSSSSDFRILVTSSDCCFLTARGCASAFAGAALAFVVFGLAFALTDFTWAIFALAAFALRGAFAALAFFGADFAPAVLRVRIQILRSAQPACAKLDVFKTASDRAPLSAAA
jgi:hypothetical protein